MSRLSTSEASQVVHPAETGKEDRHFVTALARGLGVLCCFNDARELLGNQEIAERSGLPKSTVSRLTHTLTRLGYLATSKDTTKYHLGGASVAFATSVFRNFGVRQVADPILKELAFRAGTSVSLGVRSQLNMVYIDHYRGNSPFSLNAEPGWQIPIALTSMGRAYLAACAATERQTVLELLAAENFPDWPKILRQLEQAMEEYQSRQCCSSYGDWHAEVNAIATTVVEPHNGQTVVISCGGPAFKLTPDHLQNVVRPLLLNAAAKIQEELIRLT